MPGGPDCVKWYLVYTKPRQEPLAQQHLQRQGYPTYLPLARHPRRRRGRRTYITEAFFPRYLFIHLDSANDNWAPIRSTIGVSSLVRFGQQPAAVPDDLIAKLRARENPEGLQEILVDYRAGDHVRIHDGPMAGYEGIFIARNGEERVILLLDMMGKQARLQVDIDAISLASS